MIMTSADPETGATANPSASPAVAPEQLKWLKLLRATLLFLVFFDLAIAIPALFFPEWAIGIAKLNSDAVRGAMYRSGTIEPLFLRGVGILWLVAAYVQLLAWRDPLGRLVAVNIALVFRFLGGTFELVEAAFLLPRVGFGDPLIFGVLAVFVAGDYLLVGLMVFFLHELRARWW
jgi:hypothetical protein